MSLFTAVLGVPGDSEETLRTPWGSCSVHPDDDPTTLARSLPVQDPATTHVLVLAPRALAARAAVAASTISAVRTDLAVLVETRDLSTSGFLRAVELAGGDDTTSPNQAVAGVRAVVDTMVWGAWLPGVGKLETPAPTVLQHVSSMFARGQGFLAVKGSPGWVASLPVEPLEQSRRLPRSTTSDADELEAVAWGDLPEAAIKTLFDMGLRSRPKVRPAVGATQAAWGSPRAVEFVITHPSASRLGPPAGFCRVCDEPVWGGFCPFCRSAISPTSRTEAQPTNQPTNQPTRSETR